MSESTKTYVGTSGWKGKDREKERARREKSPKKGSESSLSRKEVTSTPSHGHIASQCPNRRVMIVKDDGEVESESSIREVSISSEVECLSDDSHYEGYLLVVRRCLILGNLCSMIINGVSCVNMASERLVKKLTLPIIVHLRSYRLHWLSEKGELLVDSQAEVMFTLGGYEDKVICDVVPMEATHFLPGKPWQFDKIVIHDGVTNWFTFIHLEGKGCT
ncbi:hypothetical protein CR513_11515, partial [Mucuna pruriens]